MTDPSISELARTLNDLQRRLAAMERSAQLPYSSVQTEDGGTVTVRSGLLSAVQASTDAATALAGLVDLQAQADGKVTVFYRDAAPTEAEDNPEYGDQWLVTAQAGAPYLGTTYLKGTLLRYDGDTWLLVQDQQAAADALALAQNAQDTADGKIETYWAPTDPVLTGTTASSGDLWYQTNAANNVLAVWRWDVAIPGWRNLPITAGAIAVGAVTPDRLTVGVVANLVQDPVFLGSTWTPPVRASTGVSDWDVAGPDVAYADSNYLRCRNRTAGTGPASGLYDSTFYLVRDAPVDPGRTIRLAALVRSDAAGAAGTGPGGLTTPTFARLRVYLQKPDGSVLSGTAQITAMILTDVMAGVYEQWVPLVGTFTVPEGYSQFSAAAQVSYQTAGHVDFIKPEVQVLWGQVQSADYVQGEVGWSLDSTTTQFDNVNVLGDLGAGSISTEELQFAGDDLAVVLDQLPAGVLAYGRAYATATAAIGTTRTITHELNGGALRKARIYRLVAHGHIDLSDTHVGVDAMLLYTIDGSTPTATGSQILDGSLVRVNGGSTTDMQSNSFRIECYYLPQNDYAVTKFALALDVVAGTGTATIPADVNRGTEFALEDLGATDAVPASGNNGRVSQRSKAGGAAADPNPVVTYTREWTPLWGRSYTGASAVLGTDPPELWQGYDRLWGLTRSLVGYDYANIQAALAGATIRSIRLNYKVKHAEASSGLNVIIASHNYTSMPTVWAAGPVVQGRATFTGQREGSAYSQLLPVAIANELKAGSTRGLGFGPATTSSTATAGYLYGLDSLTPPRLVIVYSK